MSMIHLSVYNRYSNYTSTVLQSQCSTGVNTALESSDWTVQAAQGMSIVNMGSTSHHRGA